MRRDLLQAKIGSLIYHLVAGILFSINVVLALSRVCLFSMCACTYSQVGKSVAGLIEMVKESLERCPIDNRKDVFKNILLTGT